MELNTEYDRAFKFTKDILGFFDGTMQTEFLSTLGKLKGG